MRSKKSKPVRVWTSRVSPPASARVRNDCRELICVDAAPYRREASEQYRQLKEKIAAVVEEIQRFEQVTLPEYESWHARSFGALLTQERSLQAAMDEKHELLDAVEDELARRGGSESAAYHRVLAARARRAAGTTQPEGEASAARSFEDAFRETVRHLFGIDPEAMHPRDREFMEKAFRRDMGVEEPEEEPPPPRRATKKEKAVGQETSAREVRCKQLYRLLVMRLHPDTGGENTAAARQLWNDLQDAWARRDLDRLELIQAIVELHEGGPDASLATATLGQLRRIVREVATAWRDVQKHRKALARHPAMQLANPVTAKKLAATIGAKLQDSIRHLERENAAVEALFKTWDGNRPARKSARARADQSGFRY